MKRMFNVSSHGTTLKKEIAAGLTSFFTIAYIIPVNATILHEAGMPLGAAMAATTIVSFVGCVLAGLWGRSPLIIVPGMGLNAFFSYTLVQTMGMSWQDALGIVFVSGLLFVILSFSKASSVLMASIPNSLKMAMIVGVGMLLAYMGLQKSGIIAVSKTGVLQMGNLSDPATLVSLLTFAIALVLFLRQVPGSFLIAMLIGVAVSYFLHLSPSNVNVSNVSINSYLSVFGSFSFERVFSFSFWMATVFYTFLIMVENMGIVGILLKQLDQEEKFPSVMRANALSNLFAGWLGTSATVTAGESATSVVMGGKTGITAITAGSLFVLVLFFTPLIQFVPEAVVAPILVIVGGLIMQNIKEIPVEDVSEWMPAFLIIVLIPFTFSIANGMAWGLIIYPFLKVILGKAREVSSSLYVIAVLMVIYLMM